MGLSTNSVSADENCAPRKFLVVPIHRHPALIPECVKLINSEWPRSIGARLWSLEASNDNLPTCLVLTKNAKKSDDKSNDSKDELSVLAHLKLTPIPAVRDACFVESVVVWKSLRGQGIGSYLMREAENYCKFTLKLRTIYLSTTDAIDFYTRLGYEPCPPVSIYGGPVVHENSLPNPNRPTLTKKKYMKKVLIQDEDDEISR